MYSVCICIHTYISCFLFAHSRPHIFFQSRLKLSCGIIYIFIQLWRKTVLFSVTVEKWSRDRSELPNCQLMVPCRRLVAYLILIYHFFCLFMCDFLSAENASKWKSRALDENEILLRENILLLGQCVKKKKKHLEMCCWSGYCAAVHCTKVNKVFFFFFIENVLGFYWWSRATRESAPRRIYSQNKALKKNILHICMRTNAALQQLWLFHQTDDIFRLDRQTQSPCCKGGDTLHFASVCITQHVSHFSDQKTMKPTELGGGFFWKGEGGKKC